MDFFKIFGKKQTPSSNVAKERLQLVILQDTVNCSQEKFEMMKTEIINVISKYMDIDTTGLDIQIADTKSDIDVRRRVLALVANIPIQNMRK